MSLYQEIADDLHSVGRVP